MAHYYLCPRSKHYQTDTLSPNCPYRARTCVDGFSRHALVNVMEQVKRSGQEQEAGIDCVERMQKALPKLYVDIKLKTGDAALEADFDRPFAALDWDQGKSNGVHRACEQIHALVHSPCTNAEFRTGAITLRVMPTEVACRILKQYHEGFSASESSTARASRGAWCLQSGISRDAPIRSASICWPGAVSARAIPVSETPSRAPSPCLHV